MKLKIDYRILGKSFEEKFYYLCNELYPNLLFSKIDRKGYVVITEKGEPSLFRRRIKKHIIVILQCDIASAISLTFFGNVDLVGFYNRKVAETFYSSELANVRSAILMMCSEFKDRSMTKNTIMQQSENSKLLRTSVELLEADEPQDEQKGIAYLFDFIFRPTKLRHNFKNYLLALSIRGQLVLGANQRIYTPLSFMYNLCMRDPPVYIPQTYNTS